VKIIAASQIVTISTQYHGGFVEIRIADNGPGIPETIRKNPSLLFTTKPTGQGTGLGLSYVIVKAYGGELKVEAI
jgi:two-component system, NtrC family, sensor kinase